MNEISETSKLTVKNLGNPKRAAVDEKEVVLGTIFGRATGTKMKMDGAGNAHEAIVGTFEGRSADGKNVTRAAMLYLPGGLHEGIVERLKAMNGAPAEFAVEVKAVPAQNPAGYSYAMRSLVPLTVADDPLAAIRAAAGFGETSALPASEKTVEEMKEAAAADNKKK